MPRLRDLDRVRLIGTRFRGTASKQSCDGRLRAPIVFQRCIRRAEEQRALRVEGGKAVEHWGVPGRLYALVQLGLISPPAPRPASAPAM